MVSLKKDIVTTLVGSAVSSSGKEKSSRHPTIGIGLAGLTILVAVLAGVMIGAEIWIPLAMFAAAGVALITNAVFLFKPPSTRLYLHLAIAVTLIAPAIQGSIHAPIGYAAEGAIACLFLPLLRIMIETARRDSYLRSALVAYAAFLAIATASSFVGHSQRFAAAWQFVYDIKWLFMLGLGLLTSWGNGNDQTMRRLVRWGWVVILPYTAVEALAPGVFSGVMGDDPYIANPFAGFLPGRMKGPFVHAGYLSNFSGFLAAACLILSHKEGMRPYRISLVAYVGFMVLAGEREEFADWVIVICGILAIRSSAARYLLVALAAIAILAVVALTAYAPFGPIDKILAQWNFFDPTSPLSERGLLTMYGADVANRYFPLGSGLGTYAGPGAQKFDQSLFIELGFLKYWWFREGKFLVDVYWPNFIAEGGWAGALCVLISNIALGLRLWVLGLRHNDRNQPLYLLGLSAFGLMFLNTPTSQIVMDPRGVMVFWIVIGIAIREGLHSLPTPQAIENTRRRTMS